MKRVGPKKDVLVNIRELRYLKKRLMVSPLNSNTQPAWVSVLNKARLRRAIDAVNGTGFFKMICKMEMIPFESELAEFYISHGYNHWVWEANNPCAEISLRAYQ